MKICGASKCDCYRQANIEMFQEDDINGLENKKAKKFRKMRNCLPSCASVTYDTEVDRQLTTVENYEFSMIM